MWRALIERIGFMDKQKAKASYSQKDKYSDVFLDYNCSLTLRKVNNKNRNRSKALAAHRRSSNQDD